MLQNDPGLKFLKRGPFHHEGTSPPAGILLRLKSSSASLIIWLEAIAVGWNITAGTLACSACETSSDASEITARISRPSNCSTSLHDGGALEAARLMTTM